MQIVNSQNRLIVGTCQTCNSLVRIPVSNDLNANVRCPHCGTTRKLEEILDVEIPTMELITEPEDEQGFDPSRPPIDQISAKKHADDQAEQMSRKPGDRFEVSPILSKGAKRKKRRRSRSSSSSSSDSRRSSSSRSTDVSRPSLKAADSKAADSKAADSNGSATVEMSAPSRKKSRSESTKSKPSSRSRKKKKTKQPFRVTDEPSRGLEVFKVAIGAMIALPIAQLMIWWWIGVDPIGMGKPVSRIVPALVPAQLRADEEADQAFDTNFQNPTPTNPAPRADDGKLPKSDVDPDSIRVLDDWLK